MQTMRLTGLGLLVIVLTAGCGGQDGDPDPATPGTDPAASAGLEVEAGDLYFAPTRLTVAEGEATFTLRNVGVAPHDLVIEELGDLEVAYADPGATATGTVELAAGTYTFYCSIPGHRAMMEGVLEVG
jgi:uncharacterized cupredoxin-like copper-binding protein